VNLFRIFSEFLVIFRHFSEYLAQKLVYSESLDFVVLVRKGVDLNEHERLFNLSVIQQLKYRNNPFVAVLHYLVTVGSSIMNLTHILKKV
jgi:hypothetical protein